MILDRSENLHKYTALCRRFALVCDFLENIYIYALNEGRYPIDGDDVYMTVASGLLRGAKDAPLEVHDEYIDIHIPMAGPEIIGWRWRGECVDPRGEMNTENDILFYGDSPVSYLDVPQGTMAICFTDDAHTPLIGEGQYRKCIFKIRKNE